MQAEIGQASTPSASRSAAIPSAASASSAAAQSAAGAIGASCGVSLSSASLRAIAEPARLQLTSPRNRPIVIVDDGTTLTTETAHNVGNSAVVLTFGSGSQFSRSVTLRDRSEESLVAAIAQIERSYGVIGGFIHLHSDQVKPGWVLLAAKCVSASLAQHINGGRTSFLTVSRMDGMLGLGHSQVNDVVEFAESGALFGLVKTLAQEWPHVFCRAVDIDPSVVPVLASQHIAAELACADKTLRETGYGSSGQRYTTGANPIDAPQPHAEFETKHSRPSDYQPSDAFLVAGGGRGITPVCMASLARRVGGGTYILLGRSPVSPEPAWARGIDEKALQKAAMAELKRAYAASGNDKSQKPTPRRVKALMKTVTGGRAVRESIARIEAAGGRAIYMACDVTDAAQVRSTAQKVASQGIRITGIVHASGVLRDKRVENKSLADFNAVYGTKVVGLRNLLAAVELSHLRHVVVFSSLAGFHGNVGQSDYAMANEVLNKAAHAIAHRYPQCRARALDFGPWDGGMVTPALKAMFKAQGVEIIPRQEGGDIVAALLTDTPEVQTLVGNWGLAPVRALEKTHTISKRVIAAASPFLGSHIIKRKTVLPMTVAAATLGDAALSLYPGYHLSAIENTKHFQGIFLDSQTELEITVKEDASSTDDILRLSTAIGVRVRGGRTRPKYKAEVVLTSRAPEAPTCLPDTRDERLNWGKARCYDGTTLFHGPALQSVEEVVNMSQRRITLRCRDVVQQPGALGQFDLRLDGVNTDTVMQGMLVWARAQRGIASLPSDAKRFEFFSKIPVGQEYFVTLEADGTSTKDTTWQARYHMHAADGTVYGRGAVGVTLHESLSFV